MPNWCANLLEIAGPVEEKKRLVEYVKPKDDKEKERTSLSLKSIVPYPDGYWDYDWCVENWGTKWDIDATLFIDGEFANIETDLILDFNPSGNLVYKFDSAWAPPIAAIRKLAEEFPRLEFRLLFAEPGVDFSGCENFNPNALLNDREYYNQFPATNQGNISDIIAGYIWSYGG